MTRGVPYRRSSSAAPRLAAGSAGGDDAARAVRLGESDPAAGEQKSRDRGAPRSDEPRTRIVPEFGPILVAQLMPIVASTARLRQVARARDGIRAELPAGGAFVSCRLRPWWLTALACCRSDWWSVAPE